MPPGFAQDEHNFLVKPQFTTCDSLSKQIATSSDPFQLLYASKFRFSQNFKIPGSSGVQQGNYFSCDNETGFLVLVVDEKTSLYLEVPTQVWSDFIQSADPFSFYKEEIREKYQFLPSQQD